MSETSQAVPQTAEPFVLDAQAGEILFSDGTRWRYFFDYKTGQPRMTPEEAITAAIHQFLKDGPPLGFRSISASFQHEGIRYSGHGGKFDPVPDPTWKCWVWMIVPPGWDFFPDYATVYVRDSDGLAWTLEWEDAKQRRRVPSYELANSPWYGKPRSDRRKPRR